MSSIAPINLSQRKAWFLVTRPRSLALSSMPVFMGIALASTVGNINWLIATLTWVFALCIQIATNLFNDALDFKNGVDSGERLGPPRMTQSGHLSMKQVLIVGYILLFVALLCGLPLIERGGWTMVLLLVISAILAYAYTGGPFPLSYIGLGEVFVLPFFGLAATGASYFLQTDKIDPIVLLAGTQIGLLATLPIPLNNLRDHKGDSVANKRTLIVRFGVPFGKCEVTVIALLPFVLSLFWFQTPFVWAAVYSWIALPLAIILVRNTWKTQNDRDYNTVFFESLRLHLLFGIMFIFGVLR